MQLIIPVFIMHRGCRHRCIFCNAWMIAGKEPELLSRESFCETVYRYLHSTRRKPDRVQIAFYGGNFTGMAHDDQTMFLEYAKIFVRKGLVHNIRVSTRPDCIDAGNLHMLKSFHVKTVEIGAQSMVDEVLNLANRGHSSLHVANAMDMLQQMNFETGIHLMMGLPGDTRESFAHSVEKTIAMRPDTVRIHPTLVFENTDLAKDYLRGSYAPLELTEAVELGKNALKRFDEARIPVIRLGLHTTRDMEASGSIKAGPYHPAFRSLVEESLYFDMVSSLLSGKETAHTIVTVILSPKDVSTFRGKNNRNVEKLKTRFGLKELRVSVDENAPRRSPRIVMHDTELKRGYPCSATKGTSIV